MTAQVPDILLVRGMKLDLYDQPLYPYLRKLGKRRRPDFAPSSSALWRGYVATWEIRDASLWLLDLEGWMRQGEEVVAASLVNALPSLKPPVKATWFTGMLRCPEGAMVTYRHAGYASDFERDRNISVSAGSVDGEWLVINPPPPIEYSIAPDGTRSLAPFALADGTYFEDPFAPYETPVGGPFWAAEAEAIRREAAKGDPLHVAAYLKLI